MPAGIRFASFNLYNSTKPARPELVEGPRHQTPLALSLSKGHTTKPNCPEYSASLSIEV